MKRFLALSNRGMNTRYFIIENGLLTMEPDTRGQLKIKAERNGQTWTAWCDSAEIRTDLPGDARPETVKFPLEP